MKKGQEELMFVFSLILIALILTLSFIIFSIGGKNRVQGKIDALESNEVNINLLNYLRTNDTKTGMITADLIMDSYYKNNYDDVKRVTQEFFDKFHDKNKCKTMIINMFDLKNNKQIFQLISLGKGTTTKTNFVIHSSFILIPTFEQNNIKVAYSEGCKYE